MGTESDKKHYESEYEQSIQKCLRCSICKWIPQIQIKSQKYASICPAIDEFNFHSYSGGGKIILACSLYFGRMELSQDIADIVFKCTECGGCATACKYLNNLEPLEVIQELREKLCQAGIGPMDKQKIYGEITVEKFNPYNEEHSKRLDWIPDDIKLTKGATTVYYVGCTSSYRRQEIAIATARVLTKAGVEFDILEEERCCGSPVYRTGQIDKFEPLMDYNLDLFKKKGVKKVIMSCAGCYSTFKAEYARHRKYDFELLHSTELFAQLISDGKLKLTKNVPMEVTYHDPCHLGRCSEPYEEWHGKTVQPMPTVYMDIPPKPIRRGTNGVYEPPREVLHNIPGLTLKEMERIKEYSYCCGAGGGCKAQFPEFALNTAKRRLDEAESTGATVLASACPFCETNLKDAIEASNSKMKFYDISELILMAMEEK
ncbi:MAG: (Fe-S)-binding protein [Candidatus Helarchaeota archaeon]